MDNFTTMRMIEELNKAMHKLIKERDGLRREVCRLLDKDSEFRVPNEITAKRKGWDCYEDETP